MASGLASLAPFGAGIIGCLARIFETKSRKLMMKIERMRNKLQKVRMESKQELEHASQKIFALEKSVSESLERESKLQDDLRTTETVRSQLQKNMIESQQELEGARKHIRALEKRNNEGLEREKKFQEKCEATRNQHQKDKLESQKELARARQHIHALETYVNEILQREKTLLEDLQQSEAMRYQLETIKMERQLELVRARQQIDDLDKSVSESLEREMKLLRELPEPIQERQKKIDFVNHLNLETQQTNSLLLIGTAGAGESTFLSLLKHGPKPERSMDRGDRKIGRLSGYVDTVRIGGWTHDELLKLFVLFLYHGVPKDLIVFLSKDRWYSAITELRLLGVRKPMIVIMEGSFWRDHGTGLNTLKEADSGYMEESLHRMYDTVTYKVIEDFGLGTPITHQVDINALMDEREETGIRPFKHLLDRLTAAGRCFRAEMHQDAFKEAIFRLIYVYENVYNRDQSEFLKHATLQQF